ncbi:hypothetical protein CEUSTIGMA_g1869.t1 [Chlamydomonas eustigma]|uniref:CAF1B/HIR1 beta-propeller domain-containing protein n=1 Tax=Chlamydomonas eustigma TaxID=1157962 RepID=A0A250WV58_9CHLO|nr:hypothetical protein CEUSTIGMA_g1869.t1 [Chlamydomonas eustigma]|eukprot:GAX74420.1 hypothetical protein CEUSTIGMA_g1869.t1 [Chlamydomonas eustigma]
MRVKTLQIVWHEKEPVCSVDFSKDGILATGGADKTIKVLKDPEGSPAVRFLANHRGLSHAVNIIRFSPCGDILASGGDRGEVVLWKQPDLSGSGAVGVACIRGNLDGAGDEDEGDDKQQARWKISGTLRGHRDDVLDLCWSPDASCLVTGSIEKMCLMWEVEARKAQLRLENHAHYVQGVAWDPLGHYVVSQSNDRTCKIYSPKFQPAAAAGKRGATAAAASASSPSFGSCAATIKDYVLQATLSRRTAHNHSNALPPPAAGAEGSGFRNKQQQQQKQTPNNAALGTPPVVGVSCTAGNTANAASQGVEQADLGSVAQQVSSQTQSQGQQDSELKPKQLDMTRQGSGTAAALAAATSTITPKQMMTTKPQAFKHSLFQDEGMASFYRRLAWSPEGTYLAVPAGMYKTDASAPALNGTYVFKRGDWSNPLLVLPSGMKPVVAVRFCPVLFRSQSSSKAPAASGTAVHPIQSSSKAPAASGTAVHPIQSSSKAPAASGTAVHPIQSSSKAPAASGTALHPIQSSSKAPAASGTAVHPIQSSSKAPAASGTAVHPIQSLSEAPAAGGTAVHPSLITTTTATADVQHQDHHHDNSVQGNTRLRNQHPADSIMPTTYKMVLAVATMDSVLLYETETFSLLCVLGGLHLAAITDLAWAPDASTLAVSSRDGFCSLATFEPGELGIAIDMVQEMRSALKGMPDELQALLMQRNKMPRQAVTTAAGSSCYEHHEAASCKAMFAQLEEQGGGNQQQQLQPETASDDGRKLPNISSSRVPLLVASVSGHAAAYARKQRQQEKQHQSNASTTTTLQQAAAASTAAAAVAASGVRSASGGQKKQCPAATVATLHGQQIAPKATIAGKRRLPEPGSAGVASEDVLDLTLDVPAIPVVLSAAAFTEVPATLIAMDLSYESRSAPSAAASVGEAAAGPSFTRRIAPTALLDSSAKTLLPVYNCTDEHSAAAAGGGLDGNASASRTAPKRIAPTALASTPSALSFHGSTDHDKVEAEAAAAAAGGLGGNAGLAASTPSTLSFHGSTDHDKVEEAAAAGVSGVVVCCTTSRRIAPTAMITAHPKLLYQPQHGTEPMAAAGGGAEALAVNKRRIAPTAVDVVPAAVDVVPAAVPSSSVEVSANEAAASAAAVPQAAARDKRSTNPNDPKPMEAKIASAGADEDAALAAAAAKTVPAAERISSAVPSQQQGSEAIVVRRVTAATTAITASRGLSIAALAAQAGKAAAAAAAVATGSIIHTVIGSQPQLGLPSCLTDRKLMTTSRSGEDSCHLGGGLSSDDGPACMSIIREKGGGGVNNKRHADDGPASESEPPSCVKSEEWVGSKKTRLGNSGNKDEC